MNIGNALGFPVASPSVKRTDARKDAGEGEAPRSANSTAQFAAFLSLLVNNNPKVRSDLLKQLPENSEGMLDHLLSEGEVEANGTADTTSIFTNTSSSVAQLPNSAAMASAMPFGATSNALEAARYGMMTDVARANIDSSNEAMAFAATATVVEKPTAEMAPVTNPVATPVAKPEVPVVATNTTKVAAPKEAKKITITSADINAALLAEVRSTIADMQSGTNSSIEYNADTSSLTRAGTQTRLSQAVLSRIASKKGVSVEEMMAVGDTEGAQARQGLDALLAKAGTPEGMSIAAVNAASNALTAALATSAADTSKPVTDVSALDPELQSRLTRVIDRMKNEFGHDVTVVETARSQERQNMLYEQGRSTPGNKVTWTQNSLHTQGEAVDLLVDGNWNNKQGFDRLQQIAKEEGLHTIPNDPGHVELPRENWSSNADVRVQSFTNSAQNSQNMPVSNGIARVATVARVASVASTTGGPAPVAPQIEQPKVPSTPLDASLGLAPRAQNDGSKNSQTSSNESSSEQTPKRASIKSAEKATAHPAAAAAYTDDVAGTQKQFVGPIAEPQHVHEASAVNGAERIEKIDAVREQQGSKSLSQITLEVDGPDGASQKITVGVNGKVVDTHISADSTNADRMRANVGELKSGLESRGLEADTVRISSQGARANDTTEGVKTGVERDALRMQGTGNASAMNDQSTQQQGMRDRSSAARDWENKQQARDEQRAQHRDAQGRGSGNQDRQRPQYQEKK